MVQTQERVVEGKITTEMARVIAFEIALMLNESHCTGEPLHELTHALLDDAQELGDIVEAWACIVGPRILLIVEEEDGK